jgi:hypothetical protein
MEVTFTKLPGRRYLLAVARERGPDLEPRQGPGYDDYLPHDAVHFLVEAEAGLTGGVFGRIAAGRNNLFWPADPDQRRRQARREKKWRPTPAEQADMARSEQLASLGRPLWEWRTGHRTELPPWFSRIPPDVLEAPLVRRILARLEDFAAQWHPLPAGTRPTGLPRPCGHPPGP